MKTLIVDAICGGDFLGDQVFAVECQKTGMATFTGNQWNEKWEWNRKALEACTLETLQELYETLRMKRESAQRLQTENASKQSSLILQ